MQLTLKYGLPFITASLAYRQREVEVSHVLVDTGSARTTFAADVVAQRRHHQPAPVTARFP